MASPHSPHNSHILTAPLGTFLGCSAEPVDFCTQFSQMNSFLGRQVGRRCSSSSRQTGDRFGENHSAPSRHRLCSCQRQKRCHLHLQKQEEGKCMSQKGRRLRDGEVLLSPHTTSGDERAAQTGERAPSDYKTLLPSQDSHLPRALPSCLIWPEFFSAQNVNTQQLQMIVLRLCATLANFLLLI